MVHMAPMVPKVHYTSLPLYLYTCQSVSPVSPCLPTFLGARFYLYLLLCNFSEIKDTPKGLGRHGETTLITKDRVGRQLP